MILALLIPVHNKLDFTSECLNRLMIYVSELRSDISVVVIDDGSSDGTAEWIRKNHPSVTVLRGTGNLWWSGATNLGAKYALEVLKCQYILLWNNDISFGNDYFDNLLELLKKGDRNTIIGSKILVKEEPSLVWSMGGRFNPMSGKYYMYGYFKPDGPEYNKVWDVDWLTGMGTVIPTNAIKKNGYWNDRDFPQYHGDSDFTYRAKLNGFNVKVFPELVIYNNTKSSGIEHDGSIKKLLLFLTSNRSKSNFKNIYKFYKLHSTSPLAYCTLCLHYIKIFGGFIKWQILGLFGISKR